MERCGHPGCVRGWAGAGHCCRQACYSANFESRQRHSQLPRGRRETVLCGCRNLNPHHVQDGSELPATFGMSEDKIGYLIAGGRTAMFETLADAEDDAVEGHRAASACKAGDALIAIAASGSTPYTIAVAKRAKELGATVIAVVNNPNSGLAAAADMEIFLDSGPEVIMGSTRMGAGSAQKAALNLLSTLTHIKLGAVHDGMMVNVRADNLKLKARACNIVSRIAKASEKDAAAALETSKGEVKPAVLICSGASSIGEARKLLVETKGNLRLALKKLAATQ